MRITECKGEGQGSCKRCLDQGKRNRMRMCFLYHIEGLEGCYCYNCVKEIQVEEGRKGGRRMTANELLECLTDRPCEVCKFHEENGCSKWKCVFEEVREDENADSN